jgi:exodeoxyribonuclease VIII
MTTPFEGIKLGVPAKEYHASEGVNHSNAKEMDISPRHYLQKISAPPEEPSDAQVIGTITHSAILENDFSGFVVKPRDMTFTTKEGKAWRDAQTKQIITQDVASNIAGMVTAVKNHPLASRILFSEKGNNEVSCWATHKPTGLLIKGRADRVTMDAQDRTVIVDVKTTDRGGASPAEFSRSILKWSYASQASFYCDLFGSTYFVFCVVEKEPPFAVNCFSLAPEAIQYGRNKYEKWLAKIKECAESGKWPAYSDDLQTISIPEWALKKANEL